MIETPYFYRLQNFVELGIVSEKNYSTNVEELQINLGLRPLELIINPAPINFLSDFFK